MIAFKKHELKKVIYFYVSKVKVKKSWFLNFFSSIDN